MADPYGLLDDGEGTGRRRGLAARVALVVLALVLVTAVLVAGAAGLLVTVSVVAGVVALALTGLLPGAPARRSGPRPGPPVPHAAFRAYREVAEQLSWAAVSPRHYDLMTRPLLAQLAAARLADRHRVDLVAEPEAAAELIGPDVWPWVDPARPPSRDSQPPGVSRATLTRIVDRLEAL